MPAAEFVFYFPPYNFNALKEVKRLLKQWAFMEDHAVEEMKGLFFLLLYLLPDWPFCNFRASKSVDRRLLCSWRTSCGGFQSSKIVRGLVGYANNLCLKMKKIIAEEGKREENRGRHSHAPPACATHRTISFSRNLMCKFFSLFSHRSIVIPFFFAESELVRKTD